MNKWFVYYVISKFCLQSSIELQLTNKPLPRQKPTAETFSDTPLPGYNCYLFTSQSYSGLFASGPWLTCFFSLGKIRMNQIRKGEVIKNQRYDNALV